MRALKIERSITRRDEKSLERYFTEISRIPLLTPEEEVALFERVGQGDEQALQKVVEHNLRFVVSVAKQYQHAGLKLGDLINEGNLGLMKAARRFDTSRGFKFISYGVWWVRQSILQAINEKGRKIRVPSNQQSTNKQIRTIRLEFMQEQEREPSLEELSGLTGLSTSKITANLAGQQPIRSIDAAVKEGEDTPLASLMKDENAEEPDFDLAVRETQEKQVRWLLARLPKKEAAVLELYFGVNTQQAKTLQDIGEQFDLTRERVRQIKDRALRRLRSKSTTMEPVFA